MLRLGPPLGGAALSSLSSYRGSSPMNRLNRRIFVKTLLATAASSSPAYAAFDKRVFDPPVQVGDTSAAVTIESGNQRLRISPEGTPLTYQNFLRVGNGTSNDWKPATLAGVPVVTGASFQLVTSRVRHEGLRVRCQGTLRRKASTENL